MENLHAVPVLLQYTSLLNNYNIMQKLSNKTSRIKKMLEVVQKEQLFDYDFPGHYCRQIKSLALSIPVIVGPYQNIQATLTQISDRTLIKADKGGMEYLLNPSNNALPDTTILKYPP